MFFKKAACEVDEQQWKQKMKRTRKKHKDMPWHLKEAMEHNKNIWTIKKRLEIVEKFNIFFVKHRN